MWSPYYYYFFIRSDEQYSRSTDTSELSSFIIRDLGLVQEDPVSFNASESLPWLRLTLVRADPKSGNYGRTCHDPWPEKVNLVSLVGSKRSGDRESYVALLTRIAELLQWELIEEEDDDENEDVVVWSPSAG